MLTIESLNSTKDLVAILADKNVSLRVVPGSPLLELMRATRVAYGIESLTDIETLPLKLYDINKPQVCGTEEVAVSDHTAFMDAMSRTLGTVLAGHVAFATGVVLPAIAELHNEIKDAADIEVACGIRSFKIEFVTGSSLLDVPAITEAIDQFGSLQPARELPIQLDFKPLSDEAIINLMKIGSHDYDEAIDLFVEQQTPALIRETWDVVFQGNRQDYKDYDFFRADRVKGLGRNFVTFLIASKLLIDSKALPEATGLSGMSTNKYVMYLKSLQEVAGAALFVNLANKRGEEKRGRLIDKIDNKTVFVNKNIYDRYMADGGDVETLLGAAISGDRKFYVDEINAGVEKYKNAWQYHITIARQNAASSTLLDTRAVISNWVRRHIRGNEDPVVRKNLNRIIDNSNLFVDTLTRRDLENVDVLAMRAVCQIVYSHTEAMVILAGVNEAMSTNPDVTKEDALNMSVLNYVAEWFAQQIEVA